MRAEFIAIGSELLLGDLVNTNAAMVGRALAGVGIACTHHTVVADREDDIAAAIRSALARVDVVLVSGGLGPTEDDLTREAVAAALGRALVRDRSIEDALRERFASFERPMPERNLIQADVIDGATVIDATWGTAPGQMIPVGEQLVILVPGVPGELSDMLERAVLPELAVRAGAGRIVTRTLHVAGVGESSVAERLRPVWDALPDGVSMAYLAGRGEIRVRFTARGGDAEDALARIAPTETAARALLGDLVVGSDAQDLDATVARILTERRWTLAAAESLTGGGFGERCTRIPGASAWFRGSIVAYATEAKTKLLGVPAALVDAHGVVSIEVARAMATGARAAFGSDLAVALTGVAGPSSDDRGVGTVCIAVSGDGIDEARELRLPGDRAQIRRFAVTSAMSLLERVLR
jgi:nicotinamide-nucleotide amidase